MGRGARSERSPSSRLEARRRAPRSAPGLNNKTPRLQPERVGSSSKEDRWEECSSRWFTPRLQRKLSRGNFRFLPRKPFLRRRESMKEVCEWIRPRSTPPAARQRCGSHLRLAQARSSSTSFACSCDNGSEHPGLRPGVFCCQGRPHKRRVAC